MMLHRSVMRPRNWAAHTCASPRADGIGEAVVDEHPSYFGQRTRVLEEERVRDGADEAVEAVIAGQHAEDAATAVERVAAFGTIVTA